MPHKNHSYFITHENDVNRGLCIRFWVITKREPPKNLFRWCCSLFGCIWGSKYYDIRNFRGGIFFLVHNSKVKSIMMKKSNVAWDYCSRTHLIYNLEEKSYECILLLNACLLLTQFRVPSREWKSHSAWVFPLFLTQEGRSGKEPPLRWF